MYGKSLLPRRKRLTSILIVTSRRGGVAFRRAGATDDVRHSQRAVASASSAFRRQPVACSPPPARRYLCIYYLPMTDIDARALDRELKKGSAELLILSLLDARARHGYELSKLIHARSRGELTFHIDSLYPLLYRLEERGWIKGTWVEKAGERRRRYYRVTAEGRRVLAKQRQTWARFVAAVRRVTGGEHA